MPPRDHRRGAARRAARTAAIPGLLLALLGACVAPGTAPDGGGLAGPIAKDAVGSDPTDATEGLDAAVVHADADPQDAPAPDAAPPPPDRDGDGIPDALDPAPDTPNTQLFDDDFSAVRPEWLFTSAAMEARAGYLSVRETDGIVREGWLGPQPNWTNTIVFTRIRVLARGRSQADGAGRVAVIARVQQVAPDRYLACGIDARTDQAFFAEHNGGNTAGRTLQTMPLTGAIGPWHDLAITADANQLRCIVDGIVFQETNGLFSSGSAGVRAFDASFEADRLTVHAL